MRALWIVPAIVTTACCGPAGLPPGLATTIATATPGARLYLRDAEATWAIPQPVHAMPAAVRRTVGFVAPDGLTEFAAILISPQAREYLVEKSYPSGHRSVIISASGGVLRRSHEIQASDLPTSVQHSLRQRREPAPFRIECVQQGLEEGFRAMFGDLDRTTRVLEFWPGRAHASETTVLPLEAWIDP